MAKKAPPIAGPDLAGGPDFDLAQHKGAYVFVAFDGFPWCGPCKAELPHLLALAAEYAAHPSVPAVRFVIVNDRAISSLSAVETFAKQEIVTIPVVDDAGAKIQKAYSGYGYSLVPQAFVVKPLGELCDHSLQGAKTADELQALLVQCGAPAPGGKGVPVVSLSTQPPPTVMLVPAFSGWPPEFPVPVEAAPQPRPKGLSLMSRRVMRALALHDAASELADPASRSAVRQAGLEAAARELRRMEQASTLAAGLGPGPDFAVVTPRDRENRDR